METPRNPEPPPEQGPTRIPGSIISVDGLGHSHETVGYKDPEDQTTGSRPSPLSSRNRRTPSLILVALGILLLLGIIFIITAHIPRNSQSEVVHINATATPNPQLTATLRPQLTATLRPQLTSTPNPQPTVTPRPRPSATSVPPSHLTANPTTQAANCARGVSWPSPITTLTNTGGQTVTWTSATGDIDSGNTIAISPAHGSLAPGSSVKINVTGSDEFKTAGTTLKLTFSGSGKTVSVTIECQGP